MALHYPLALDLDGREVVVVGGGKVAERKIKTLLTYGAKVRNISPSSTPWLTTAAKDGKIASVERGYAAPDLVGAVLVFAATDSPAVNAQVAADAKKAGLPVNVADNPPLSTFILPSIVRRGELTVTISTGGASPALAKFLRVKLESYFGAEYEDYLDFLAAARQRVLTEIDDENRRREFFRRLASDDFLEYFRQNDRAAAVMAFEALLALPGEDN